MRKLTSVVFVLIASLATNYATADAHRSEADAARDITSNPEGVLSFMGIQPGWTVIDVFAGAGYYSELLSHKVGDNGKVYLYNNAAYMGFVQGLDERLADNRLPNVEKYVRELDGIDLPDESVDMALMVMSYHDAYFVQEGWTVSADPLFAQLTRILKPGGVLGIVDHQAKAGTGKGHASDLHRIDPAFAKQDITSRGFKFDGETDILENPDDDLTTNVFDPSIRRKTSRFVYRFLKR